MGPVMRLEVTKAVVVVVTLLGGFHNHRVSARSTNNDVQETAIAEPEMARRCLEPKDTGTCDQWILMWYYHQEDSACYFLGYSGCGGNGNRFETKAQCEKICGVKCPPQPMCPTECEHTKDENGCARCTCPKEVSEKVCSAGESRGLCRSLMHRFAYDPKKKICREFIYGGCGGNDNNFETEQICMDVCGQL